MTLKEKRQDSLDSVAPRKKGQTNTGFSFLLADVGNGFVVSTEEGNGVDERISFCSGPFG